MVFIFGHLGLGSFLSTPIVRRLNRNHGVKNDQQSRYYGWLLVGCLLPDLIDKPLHLLNVQLQINLPIITGDKGFAHTVLFALLLIAMSIWRSNLIGKLLGLGTVTHLFLDLLGDSSHWWWFGTQAYPVPPYYLSSPKLAAYFWPFWTSSFASSSQKTLLDYWSNFFSLPLLLWEIVGLLLLIWTRSAFHFSPGQWLLRLIKHVQR